MIGQNYTHLLDIIGTYSKMHFSLFFQRFNEPPNTAYLTLFPAREEYCRSMQINMILGNNCLSFNDFFINIIFKHHAFYKELFC
uniref:Uncharacterized protein n=1 Tax=Heterorhabditis bacteriophora TaxID=37862 RepID=A0A1I7XA11_HETBA